MQNDNATGKGPSFDPSTRGNSGGQSEFGKGRERAEGESGDRSADAPKGGRGLGADRGMGKGRERAGMSDTTDTASV